MNLRMASDGVDVIALEERDRWLNEHRNDGLPSQSWNYAWALSASGVTAKLAVVRAGGARLLVPYVEREWSDTKDIATITGLSGASVSPQSAAPFGLWRDFARSRGWVAGYIRLAPDTDISMLPRSELASRSAVYVLDLEGQDVWTTASQIVRRKVNRAMRAGVTLVEDRPTLARRLVEIYPQTMQRIPAAKSYYFTAETLARWSFDPSSVILGAQVGDDIEAVCIFLTAGKHAEWHTVGNTISGRTLSAWLIWTGVQRLREMGIRWLNLGGGVRPGDGLHAFKEKFGAAAQPAYALHQIYDREKYRALCPAAHNHEHSHWFPAYRSRE